MRIGNVIKIKETYFVIIGSLKETKNWFGKKSIEGVSNLIYDKWILLVVNYEKRFHDESYETTNEIVVIDSKIDFITIDGMDFRHKNFENKLKLVK
jgi:hypothetical protein